MSARFTLKSVLTAAFILLCGITFAQKGDTIKYSTLSGDSTKHIAQIKPKHSPSKALLFSAVLPGLGQAYNHKYWKIPIIYAGLGAATYFIVFNWQQYTIFKNAISVASNPVNNGIDPAYPAYSLTDLTSARDYYHRDRDLSFLVAIVVYTLNLVDAEVDAQMFSFNVTDDISMRISPTLSTFSTGLSYGMAPSLSIKLNLK